MTRFLATFLVLAGAAVAAENWIQVKSSNFELLTTSSEKRGREAVLYFEQVRGFFMTAFKSSGTPLPVRIVAFGSEKEYRPYRPNEFAVAFYLGAPDRDYIVMNGLNSERFPVAVHEYAHLLIRHSGMKIPAWLNEGLAELYSTLTPVGKKVRIGDLIPGRFQLLLREKWIPLAAVVAVDHSSPLYNEKDRAGMFYSESWALVHMMMLEAQYRPKFGAFAREIDGGMDTAAAFVKIYGKPVEEVAKDLNSYVRGTTFNAAVFDVKLEKSAEVPETAAAPPVELGMSLASLLPGSKTGEAITRYEKLATEHPTRPEPAEALAYMALRTNDRDKAVTHLARAVERGSANPKTYWDYAVLLQGREERKADMAAALEKLLTIQPVHFDARMMLSYLYASDKQFKKALDCLAPIRRVDKQQAPGFFRMLTNVQTQLDNREEAVKAAKRWAEVADAGDKPDIERLMAYLQRKPEERTFVAVAPEPAAPPKLVQRRTETAEPPAALPLTVTKALTVRLEGKLQHIDCMGTRARMILSVNGKVVRVMIEDPNSITIQSGNGAPVDFTCGPQKARPIAVDFLPKDDLKQGTVGVVRALEFQ